MTRTKYADRKDREYFHIMLNLDSFDGFAPTARRLAEKFLDDARERQLRPDLEPELRPFVYDEVTFEARMDQVYQGLADDVAHYEAARSWSHRTKDDVVDWILQMAPFNQTDGAWLRYIAAVGPMDEVNALLFGIYADELGGGDASLNHANLYTKLLSDAGFELPDIRSRAYIDDPAIVDAAFTLPLFQLVVSQFPQDFFAELLGMTLYLEWGSLELKNMVLLNRHFGLDTQFYEMHVAIDNAATGHGAKALRAVQLHLERVRVSAGDEAMQEQWGRIWDGYVAFATTGELGQEMAARRDRPRVPADRVAAMIADRASKARLNHGAVELGGVLLNDLFADPRALMAALVDGGWVIPGDPEGSRFFGLVAPTGPMYRIFTDAELATWREWVHTLGAGPPATPPRPEAAGDAMAALVDRLRPLQLGVPAHAGPKLTGADPDAPGSVRVQTLAWWFDRSSAELMATLSRLDNGWVVPGDAAGSRLMDVVRSSNAMERALREPTADGSTGAEVIARWIDAGCPAPGARPEIRPVTLLSPAERVAAHPTGVILGAGSVH